MKKLIFALSVAAAITSSAVAADLPVRGPAVAPAPVFVGMNWTGVYVGGQVGYGWNNSRWSNPAGVPAFAFNNNGDGVLGGLHLGYNHQIGSLVLGIDGEANASGVKGSGLCNGNAGTVCNTKQDWLGAIRLRAGVALDRIMIYATGGVGFTNYKFNQTVAAPQSWSGGSRTGWTLGAGIDYAVTNNWIVGAQYSYYDFGTKTGTGGAGPVSVRFRQNEHVVSLRLSYLFSSAPAAVVAKY